MYVDIFYLFPTSFHPSSFFPFLGLEVGVVTPGETTPPDILVVDGSLPTLVLTLIPLLPELSLSLVPPPPTRSLSLGDCFLLNGSSGRGSFGGMRSTGDKSSGISPFSAITSST